MDDETIRRYERATRVQTSVRDNAAIQNKYKTNPDTRRLEKRLPRRTHLTQGQVPGSPGPNPIRPQLPKVARHRRGRTRMERERIAPNGTTGHSPGPHAEID